LKARAQIARVIDPRARMARGSATASGSSKTP